MQLIFHGGAQEVGRSCIEVRTGGDRYLLDCGLKFHEHGYDFPAKVFEARALDGVFLTHAHLDHSGGLPFFEHYHMGCPIFCTPETVKITKILLEDSYKIARIKHLAQVFDRRDLRKALRDTRFTQFNVEKQHRSIRYALLNAGHIPGSASIRLRAEGITLMYTGDYNTQASQLMQPSDPSTWGQVDVLITEATYGARDHPDRAAVEQAFLAKVEEVVRRGGRVLIPVFAVGRAQEILILLSQRKWDVPIYMDGMAKKVTRVIVDGPSPYVTNKAALKAMFEHAELISSSSHREHAADRPGIFLATSGMLQGGPAIVYLEQLWADPHSAVLLTGYQSPGTLGHLLDTERRTVIQGQPVSVQCEVQRFDFSAHLSRADIEQAILAVRPRVIIFNHGDREACESMRQWAQQHTGAHVYVPQVGDQIDISERGETSHQHIYDRDDGYDFPAEHQHGRMQAPPEQRHVEHDD